MTRTKKPESGVAWEPPPTRQKPDWAAVADELLAHPMEWLKVYENGRASWGTAVQLGHVTAVHPRLGFELTTTNNTRETPRTCTLYMRYNPDLVDDLAATVNETKEK